MDEVLTIPKAAEKIAGDLGLSKYTIAAYLREAIKKRELKAYKRGGKDRHYLSASDLEEYKKRQMAFTPVTLQETDR